MTVDSDLVDDPRILAAGNPLSKGRGAGRLKEAIKVDMSHSVFGVVQFKHVTDKVVCSKPHVMVSVRRVYRHVVVEARQRPQAMLVHKGATRCPCRRG